MTHSRLASNRWRLTERTAQESIVQRIINGSASPAEGTVCTKRDGGAVVARWHGGGGTAVPAYSRAVVVVVDEGGGAEGEAEGEGAAGRFRAELSFPSSVHDSAHGSGVRWHSSWRFQRVRGRPRCDGNRNAKAALYDHPSSAGAKWRVLSFGLPKHGGAERAI